MGALAGGSGASGAALATCGGGSGRGGEVLGAAGALGRDGATFGLGGGGSAALGGGSGAGGRAGLPSGAFSSGLSGAMSTKSGSPRLAYTGAPSVLTQTSEPSSRTWRTIEQTTATYGRGRYTLWTGDPGTALYLHSCLTATAAFPTLDHF